MAETTPLGFQVPSGTDLVRNGDNAIANNALLAEEYIGDLLHRTTSHIDGGTPSTLYTPEQLIDGGTV